MEAVRGRQSWAPKIISPGRSRGWSIEEKQRASGADSSRHIRLASRASAQGCGEMLPSRDFAGTARLQDLFYFAKLLCLWQTWREQRWLGCFRRRKAPAALCLCRAASVKHSDGQEGISRVGDTSKGAVLDAAVLFARSNVNANGPAGGGGSQKCWPSSCSPQR